MSHTFAAAYQFLCRCLPLVTVGAICSVAVPAQTTTGALVFEPSLISTTSGGLGTHSVIQLPGGVATDSSGNVYIADTFRNMILKMNPKSGVVSTVAGNGYTMPFGGGGGGGYSGDYGPATSAELDWPQSVAVDGNGNIYFADTGNNAVRVVYTAGTIPNVNSPIPGYIYSVVGNSVVMCPTGVAVDSAGNIYIADYGNQVVRKVTLATGALSTVASQSMMTNTGQFYPSGLAVDTNNNLYVAAGSVYELTSGGQWSVVAGGGPPGNLGDGGLATNAGSIYAWGVAVDPAGDLFIADAGDGVIREVNATTHIISTVAGVVGQTGYSGDLGPAMKAIFGGSPSPNLSFTLELPGPNAVAVDSAGNLFIADTTNSAIREVIASTGFIQTIAGGNRTDDSGAPDTSATLSQPQGLAFDPSGNLYIADYSALQVWKAAAVTTGVSTVNTQGQLSGPMQVAADGSGNVYIQDYNWEIFQVTSMGALTGVSPGANNPLENPSGLAVDVSGNVYVADNLTNQIYRVNVNVHPWAWIVIAGNGSGGDGGVASQAALIEPNSLTFDRNGNLYIADGCSVRVIYASGSVPNVSSPQSGHIYTVWSGGASCSNLNGLYSFPNTIAVDPAGDIFMALASNRVAKVSAVTGLATIVAGTGTAGYTGDGGSAMAATLSGPQGIVVDAHGNLLIGDSGNGVIRAVGPQGILAFGGQPVGVASGSQTITVTNRGSTAITLSNNPTIGGADPSDYSIVSNSCGGTSSSIAPGASCSLSVTFKPSAAGNRTASILFPNNGVTAMGTVSLTGAGTVTQAGVLVYDTGTVTLAVTGPAGVVNYPAANYGQTDTPSTIAGKLVTQAATVANSPVTVTLGNDGNSIILTENQAGSGSDYSYSLTTATTDPTDFGTGGSFSTSQTSGTLAGGTAPVTIPSTVYQYTVPPNPTDSANIGYAGNSNLQSYTDSVMGSWTFNYDSLNRLIGGTVSPAVSENTNFCWSYDSFGNRKNQSASNQPFTNSSSCQPAASANVITNIAQYSGNNNQMTQTNAYGVTANPQYDAAGNMTAINGAQGPQFLYDADGRNCAVSSPSISGGPPSLMAYLYDAEGHRVAKGTITTFSCDFSANGFVVTNQYIIGPSGEQMTELVPTVPTTPNTPYPASEADMTWVHTNVYAGGTLVATYANDGTGPHFRLTDWLGTKRAQTNYAGSLEQTCQSLPFGDGPQCTGPTEQFYTGKERDTESGLDYFGARYYSSAMGRFSSPDPSELMFADPGNPQSLNLYSYALNNPLRNTDPTGLFCYYGDTGGGAQQDADNGNASQWDYHSSQSECETADENGNKGVWTSDGETHQDASGDMVDNDNRPELYTMNTGQTAGAMTAGGVMNIGYEMGQTAVAGLLDIPIALLNSMSNPTAQINIPYFRLFLTHYCGPGGGGGTYSDTGAACQQHDTNYGKAGIDFTANFQLLHKTMTPAQMQAAQAANQALYDAAGKPGSSGSGQTSLQFWLTGQAKIPFGGGYTIYPGTEARPH